MGFRGAASIAFATYPLTARIPIAGEIFNIVFFVALVSVLIQGTFLVPFAKRLGLISKEETVLKTFTDYSGDIRAELLEIEISKKSRFVNKEIMEVDLPEGTLIVMIRRGGRIITPHGSTVLQAGDSIMLAGNRKILLEIGKKADEL